MTNDIVVLIMAAGQASRFGSCKQLQPYGEKTLLQRMVDEVNATFGSDAYPHVFVVTGCYHEAICKKIQNAQFIHNPHWEEGLGSSIALAVKTVSNNEVNNYKGVLIVLADQLAISAVHVKNLLSHFIKGNIVCASYSGLNGVPAIFPECYFGELESLRGDQGAKRILNSKSRGSASEIITIDMPEAAIDIDTPGDLNHYLADY